jgi:hypothetical protein
MDPDKALDPTLQPSAWDITTSIITDMETRMKIASSWKLYLGRLHDRYASTRAKWLDAGGAESPGSSTSDKDEGGKSAYIEEGFEDEQKKAGYKSKATHPRASVKFMCEDIKSEELSEASSPQVRETASTPVTTKGFTAVNTQPTPPTSDLQLEVVPVDSAPAPPPPAREPSSAAHSYASPFNYISPADAAGYMAQPNPGAYQYAAAESGHAHHEPMRLWSQPDHSQVLRNIARESMPSAGNSDLREFQGAGPLHNDNFDYGYYSSTQFAYQYPEQQYVPLAWPAPSYGPYQNVSLDDTK